MHGEQNGGGRIVSSDLPMPLTSGPLLPIAGWQNHPVCNRKYHFIVPGASVLADPLQLPAIVEAKFSGLAISEFRGSTSVAGEGEEDPFNSPASILDSKNHYMHGTLHANGFGHLQRMNAASDGPIKLTGHQLMTIWDSLCTLLAAREVSVEDVSNKSGMLLRTLHSTAHGSTW
jgi:hypothetical protein